jgi:hypothetical protein
MGVPFAALPLRVHQIFIEVVKGGQRNFVAAFNRDCLAKEKPLIIVCTYLYVT